MALLEVSRVKASLISACASSGAKGTLITTDRGTFNPMHELLDGLAQGITSKFNPAAENSSWALTPPAIPVPGSAVFEDVIQPGNPAVDSNRTAVKSVPYMSSGARSSASRSLASELKWTGKKKTVLFEGIHAGVIAALESSSGFLGAPEGIFIPFQEGSEYMFSPAPVNLSELSRAVIAAFRANPKLGLSGDPSRREVLALKFSEIAVSVWDRVTPKIRIAGTPLGLVPVPTVAVVIE